MLPLQKESRKLDFFCLSGSFGKKKINKNVAMAIDF
jgi:hypothetical protein